VLLLNADAWMTAGSLDRSSTSPRRSRAPRSSGPRLRNPDGTLQRSVRGYPTVWRLATEYLFLRKLAPRSSALNAFYAGASTTTRCAPWRS
jgi:GT2 family glycosyltransferase